MTIRSLHTFNIIFFHYWCIFIMDILFILEMTCFSNLLYKLFKTMLVPHWPYYVLMHLLFLWCWSKCMLLYFAEKLSNVLYYKTTSSCICQLPIKSIKFDLLFSFISQNPVSFYFQNEQTPLLDANDTKVINCKEIWKFN